MFVLSALKNEVDSSCDKAKYSKLLRSCCNIPRNDQSSNACRKSLISQSKQTTNNGEKSNLKKDKIALHACIADCIFKRNGYLHANGTLNLPIVERSLKQRFKNDEALVQLMVKSFEGCVDSAEARSKQFEWLHSKDNCDYFPATLLSCTMEHVYNNCPVTKWKNTNECQAMRKKLTDCGIKLK
ncbi:uncharacterized protein LOC6568250 [Drosophila grimshawi]|uniref:GH15785 n=1 Tax=Drosophila grimshawi TaxID=7222 RepID=B4JUH3_DROGR|nr:uncharacterized protein LOC6568250 [Drosophila grimshawi]EDV91143.1 GH15785 [Drosophila grimshawi]